jgi:hypothetical protein
MFAETGYAMFVRNTFVVVEACDAEAKKLSRRTKSCPPQAFGIHLERQDSSSAWTSPSSEGNYSNDVAPHDPRSAEEVPSRKTPSSYMLDGQAQPCSVRRWSDSSEEAEVDAPVTTMMIRNIPCCCSNQDVIRDIDAFGFADTYDFFYLPQHRKSNLGYAFINFTSVQLAAEFRERLQGHRFSSGSAVRGNNSKKECTVSPAAVQGLKNNKKHFRRTRVFKSERGPTFYKKDSSEDCQKNVLTPVQKKQVPLFKPEVASVQKHVMEVPFFQPVILFHEVPYFGDHGLMGA